MSERLWRLRRALEVVTERPAVAMASLPCRLQNPLNGRGLGVSRGARFAGNARRHRERFIGQQLAKRCVVELGAPAVVVLTRVSPRPFDDDGTTAALKSIRDGMADWWGIDDADERVTWVTDWRACARGKDAVEAALWWMPAPVASQPEFDASDYERPARHEVRAVPNIIRARGGA